MSNSREVRNKPKYFQNFKETSINSVIKYKTCSIPYKDRHQTNSLTRKKTNLNLRKRRKTILHVHKEKDELSFQTIVKMGKNSIYLQVKTNYPII